MEKVKKTTDTKILKEIKSTNKLLKEMKEILDGIWRERRPQ